MGSVDTRFFARALVAAVLAATVGLTACGRRGPLEAPPAAVATDPGAAQDPGIEKPDRPFILDPLI